MKPIRLTCPVCGEVEKALEWRNIKTTKDFWSPVKVAVDCPKCGKRLRFLLGYDDNFNLQFVIPESWWGWWSNVLRGINPR